MVFGLLANKLLVIERLLLRKGGQRRQNRLITSSLRALLTLRCPLAAQLAIISEKLENNLQLANGGGDEDRADDGNDHGYWVVKFARYDDAEGQQQSFNHNQLICNNI